ncbi:MAG: hypothetical protein HRT53_06775 [Colwellia sp.]|nr:hypothetical protein [Colwellia sp.]
MQPLGAYRLPKPTAKLHYITELYEINEQLIPLKALADRERAAIYGLTGMIYTPHIDDYMQVSIKKAAILSCLKKQGILELSAVELTSSILDGLHNRVKNNTVVEYDGNSYQRRFAPLKLSKSGKVVQKWAKFWLLQLSNGKVDPQWESQVREIWPSYFIIRTLDL